ncbi:MAG: hypothetical protein N2C12_15765 [Planctomycetales bacterium]
MTGDVESTGLESVLSEPAFNCDVLLAPHHGSINSQPVEVAQWCHPEWTIITSGLKRVSRDVLKAYTANGGQVLHTAVTGAVEVTIQNGQLSITTQR